MSNISKPNWLVVMHRFTEEGDCVAELGASLLPRLHALHHELQTRLQQQGLPPVVIRPLAVDPESSENASEDATVQSSEDLSDQSSVVEQKPGASPAEVDG